MDRWATPAIAAVVALAIGFGIGAFVYADDDAAETAPAPEVALSPTDADTAEADQETCLSALEEAEQDVEAEQRIADLVDSYEDIIDRSVDALADFDTRRLEQLLSELEELNQRSERLIDDTRQMDISAAIETCRSVLGVDEV